MMKVASVPGAKQDFRIEDRDMPEPGHGQVRLRVGACGVCHSDHFVRDGLWPGLEFPRVPGHEVVGTVDTVGEGVTAVATGDRVGIGWHGGHDGSCGACLEGDYMHCKNAQITGFSFDGGYGQYMLAPEVALARVPDGMSFTDAAPLLCAGVTTYNSLRNAGARPGDRVAIQGLGGLGHLGVRYARAMGFETVALSRGRDKESFAKELGAHHYIDTAEGDVGESLQALGGADVILATAPNAPAISALVPGLAVDGALLIVAAAFEPITVSAVDLIGGRRRIQGWPSGTASDSTDAMRFASQNGIRPMTETFALDDVGSAYDRMMSGDVRFRAVIDMER